MRTLVRSFDREGFQEVTQSFRETAIDYFRNEVGPDRIQRIDGIECFSPLPKFWFWRIRLALLVCDGVLVKKGIRSIWRSCDGMPGYGIAKAAA